MIRFVQAYHKKSGHFAAGFLILFAATLAVNATAAGNGTLVIKAREMTVVSVDGVGAYLIAPPQPLTLRNLSAGNHRVVFKTEKRHWTKSALIIPGQSTLINADNNQVTHTPLRANPPAKKLHSPHPTPAPQPSVRTPNKQKTMPSSKQVAHRKEPAALPKKLPNTKKLPEQPAPPPTPTVYVSPFAVPAGVIKDPAEELERKMQRQLEQEDKQEAARQSRSGK